MYVVVENTKGVSIFKLYTAVNKIAVEKSILYYNNHTMYIYNYLI